MTDFSAYLTPSRILTATGHVQSLSPPASSPRALSPIQANRCAFKIASELNSELAALGIAPCIRALSVSSTAEADGIESAGVDQAFAALLQEIRSAHSATRREAERANVCEVEAKRWKGQAAAASSKLRETERIAAAAAQRDRSDVAAAAASAKKALEERDCEKKAAAVAKARESRLEHEVRKLEIQGEKVLARLNSLLLQKDRAQKSGIEISRTLQRLPSKDDGERENRWRVETSSSSSMSGRVDDMHLMSKSLSVMEGRCQSLSDENTSLRFALKQLQMELVDVLKAATPPRSPAALTTTSRLGDTSFFDESVFDLPFQLAGASIEDALRNKMRRLKLHLHESQEAAAAAGSPSTHQSANEVALLRDELASALRTISDQVPSTPSETKPQTRHIILLQELTLRALAAASSATTTPNKLHTRTPVTPGRSPSVLSVDEIQEEENRLERARRQLQRDRSALNAALERFESQRMHLLGILSQPQPSHDALQAAVAFVASIAPAAYSSQTPLQRASGVWHVRGVGMPTPASSSPPQLSSQKALQYHQGENGARDNHQQNGLFGAFSP